MKEPTLPRDTRGVAAALVLTLAATRFDHFGAVPDASLAVFLFGGMLLGGWGAFAALFAVAFAVDLAAIESDAWRAYCMTPAYWGLVPTYALIWVGGVALSRRVDGASWRVLLPVAGALFSVAFVISNLTWWAFSPRFDLPFGDFWRAVARYYVPYVLSGLLYSGFFLALRRTSARVVAHPAG
jgi:hypothetical protein